MDGQMDIFGGISIHALREEGDQDSEKLRRYKEEFLSTPSARRATGAVCRYVSKYITFLSTPSARRATPTPLNK